MHIRVKDTVEVITGDDRGVRGKVLSVDRKAGKLIVEGVNRVYKHVRRSQRNPQGGRLSKEMPVPDRPTCCSSAKAAPQQREPVPGYRDDGSKERYCKKCGKLAGADRSAAAAYAISKATQVNPATAPTAGLQTSVNDEETAQIMTPRLKEKYETGSPARACASNWGATTGCPCRDLEKIVVNMGVGWRSPKRNTWRMPSRPCGRSPDRSRSITIARKAIAGFRLREGMPIGCKVTLRQRRMWEFLDRLICLAIPRVRDFRGLNPERLRRQRQLQPGAGRTVGLSGTEPGQVYPRCRV